MELLRSVLRPFLGDCIELEALPNDEFSRYMRIGQGKLVNSETREHRRLLIATISV